MSAQASYSITPLLAPLGSRRRPGRSIPDVKFIVAHDTGNAGASARGHARFYRNDPNPPLNKVSSAHIFVDDEDIVETVPALTASPEQALHVLRSVPTDNLIFGVDANAAAIGVELCYGGTIDADAAYDRFVWTLATLCKTFNLDPAHRIVGHQVLDPERRSDPDNALSRSGRSYAQLLVDVPARFGQVNGMSGLIGSAAIVAGNARATVNLNRREAASGTSARTGAFRPGDPVAVTKIVPGQKVMGIDLWCQLPEGDFCWSGGLVQP